MRRSALAIAGFYSETSKENWASFIKKGVLEMKAVRIVAIIAASFLAGWMLHATSVKAQGGVIRVIAVPTATSNPSTAQAPGTVVGFSCVPETGSSATCFVATR